MYSRFPSQIIQPSVSGTLLGVLLGGLTGLGATGLLGRSLLLSLLRAADGADTSDSLLTEIGTVVVLGSLVGNTLVDPARYNL